MRNWKEFIKPDWKKILLLIIILLPTLLITYNELDCMTMGGGCTYSEGFPFAYHSISYCAALPNPPSPRENSNIFAIVLDIIFWYLITCLLFYVYSKIKSKKKNLN